MRRILFILFCSVSSLQGQGFITEAKVEYEHKTHVKNMWKEQEMSEQMIKAMSTPYRISYHDYIFKNNESLYKPGKDAEGPQAGWQSLHPQNEIYFNHDSGIYIARKNIFEEAFLVKDSMPHIDWKITFDTRIIEGYECRKAVGRICDSVVVIAFYAERIIIPGGPESFNGLPGLVLGVVIPRLHTSWYATKIQLTAVKPSEIKAPTKGKKSTIKSMLLQLEHAVDDWGSYRNRALWIASL